MQKIKEFLIKYKTYIISCLISLGIGALSAILTMGNMDIYSEIKTPPLSPPSFFFPLIWTVLYLLMGISSAKIYEYRFTYKNGVKEALTYYAASLIINFTWSIIFFNFRSFLLAFVWILLLLFLIIKTVLSYKDIDKMAMYLQIPYIVWVAFAAYLNFGIILLN